MTKAENGLVLADDIDPEVELKRKKKCFVVKLSFVIYIHIVFTFSLSLCFIQAPIFHYF